LENYRKKAQKLKKRIDKKIVGKPKQRKIKELKVKLQRAINTARKAGNAIKIIKKVQQKVKRLNKCISAKADMIQKLNKDLFFDPSKKRQINATISKIKQHIKKAKKEVKHARKKIEKQKQVLKANTVKGLNRVIQKTNAEINRLQKKSEKIAPKIKDRVSAKKVNEAKKIIKKEQQKVKRLNKRISTKAEQIHKLDKELFFNPAKKRQIKVAISKLRQQIKKAKKRS